ncbi:MAG: Serine protease, partial [Candidatus Hydrogenedentes bacterium]|nr:Serine protease [Candidatus Hydrogenedentota bacterium]
DLGEVYRRRNLFEEASAEFSKALSIRPEYPAAHYNFGLTLAAAGHEKAAVEQFSEYLRLAPDASDAAQVKAWIAELSEQ